MKDINEAYAILSDLFKKTAYDVAYKDWQSSKSSGSHTPQTRTRYSERKKHETTTHQSSHNSSRKKYNYDENTGGQTSSGYRSTTAGTSGSYQKIQSHAYDGVFGCGGVLVFFGLTFTVFNLAKSDDAWVLGAVILAVGVVLVLYASLRGKYWKERRK